MDGGRGEEGHWCQITPGPGPRLEHPHVRVRTHTQCRAPLKRTYACIRSLPFFSRKIVPAFLAPLLISFPLFLSRVYHGHFLLFKVYFDCCMQLSKKISIRFIRKVQRRRKECTKLSENYNCLTIHRFMHRIYI